MHDRIAALAADADRAREAFEPPTDPPDAERATRYCREGLGPAVLPYLDARTDGLTALDPDDHERLRATVNEWLVLYAACYGVELETTFPLQTVATTFVDTWSARDTAQVLTGVPRRTGD